METLDLIKHQWRESITPLPLKQKLWAAVWSVYFVVLLVVAVWGGAFLDALVRGQL